jgi:UDP-glucose 4-epimerase
VLVTGGAGFIGHHLVNRLLRAADDKIIVIDDLSNGKKDRLAGNITFYQQDIRDKDAVKSIIKKEKIDCCIHLAAKISVAESTARPEDTIGINVEGTLALLEACSGHVKSFIFASSAAVYGRQTKMPVSEDQPLAPLSVYGASKMAGEGLVSAYRNPRQIPHATILRFFNAYGQNQSLEYAGVIAKFAERLSEGEPPIIHGDGSQTRDFVAVEDIVEAIILAMNSRTSGIYNIGTGRPVSVSEIAASMIRIKGLNVTPVHRAPIEGEILHSYADTKKAKKGLGFAATRDLQTQLKKLMVQLTA